jgi:hypothetical protein
MFWFYLQVLSETCLILRNNYHSVNVHRSPCKVPVILVRFLSKLNFLDRYSRDPQIPNFMKIRLAEAQLLHADGCTDMTKLTAVFRKFVNAPKVDASGKANVTVTFLCFCL